MNGYRTKHGDTLRRFKLIFSLIVLGAVYCWGRSDGYGEAAVRAMKYATAAAKDRP